MIDAPQILMSEAVITAVIHVVTPRSEMQKVFGPAVHELFTALGKQGIQPGGPLFAHHFKMTPEMFDFELGVAVAKAPETDGRVHASKLDAVQIARTIYRGPYESLPSAWGEFRDWLNANNVKQGDRLLEVYVKGPNDNPDPKTFETQLNRMLA